MTDGRPLLLIVEDDPRSATLLGCLLRGDGYDTEVETDGAAALERLAHLPAPAALITDFHLPDIDGLVIGRHARDFCAGIPIFVVTGDPRSVETANRGLDVPIEVVTKPIDYGDLLRLLHATIPVVA